MKRHRVIMAFPKDKNRLMNPYNAILYEAIEHLGWQVEEFSPFRSLIQPPEVVHLHWIEPIIATRSTLLAWLRAVVFVILLLWLRLIGTKIIWTMHNIRGHDGVRPRLEHGLQHCVSALASHIITLSSAARDQGARYLPLAVDKLAVIPHPHYGHYYQASVTRPQARQLLGLTEEEFVFVFLGQVRPYKGVLELVQAYRQVFPNPRAKARLLIAGRCSEPDYRKCLEAAIDGAASISFYDHILDDDELQIYLAAANVGVLPYRAIANSGSVLLYSSFSKPVVAPNMGMLAETVDALGEGVLYESDQPGGLAEALLLAEARYGGSGKWETIRQRTLELFDPAHIAQMHVAVYSA